MLYPYQTGVASLVLDWVVRQGVHYIVFPYNEAILSRGHVSALPLDGILYPLQTHVLSQDLVQGMPVWGGVGLASQGLDLVPRLLS